MRGLHRDGGAQWPNGDRGAKSLRIDQGTLGLMDLAEWNIILLIVSLASLLDSDLVKIAVRMGATLHVLEARVCGCFVAGYGQTLMEGDDDDDVDLT